MYVTGTEKFPFLFFTAESKLVLSEAVSFLGAAYLIWKLEMGINFKILQYPRASTSRRAMDNTYGKHAERAYMKKCKQQGNFRHQRLYRQHNTLPTCHKYKPTWSGDWSWRDWKTIAFWVALCEMLCTLWSKTFLLFFSIAKKKKILYFFWPEHFHTDP